MQSMVWQNGALVLLDQTKLPLQEEYIECRDYRRVAEAIRRLEVRGAPAIGAAAAFGLVLGAAEIVRNQADLADELPVVADELKATRPTAVNLFWAIERMMQVYASCQNDSSSEQVLTKLEAAAVEIADKDKLVNESIARHGATLFSTPVSILTHCNAGALATVAVGTALGVIEQAWREGKVREVFADETRPLLQGARLTAVELSRAGIPVTLITDNMAAWVMKTGKVQAIIVGADRIAANGDVANKIGTYQLAVNAMHHGVRFMVVAPSSTIDMSLEEGEDIPIEERDGRELLDVGGQRIAAEVHAVNPVFDVTPADLIDAIVTEKGVVERPDAAKMAQLMCRKRLH